MHLDATPFNASGDTLPGRELVHYTTKDSTISVDSTGFVTAKYKTSGNSLSFVVASLFDTTKRVTIADTCYFRVTTTAPVAPLDTFLIQPPAGDSAKRSSNDFFPLSMRAIDSAGGAMSNVFAHFTSSDPTIAGVINAINGSIQAYRTGHVTFYAETWAYGVAKKDSVVYTLSHPLRQTITVLSQVPTGSTSPVLTFWPSVATVGVGAVVTWVNRSFTDSMDVEFDDPTHVDSVLFSKIYRFYTGSGNIAPWFADTLPTSGIDLAGYQSYLNYWGDAGDAHFFWNVNAGQRQRSFPVPGVYHYRSRRWNVEASIRVVE
jgi:hypothetical protein